MNTKLLARQMIFFRKSHDFTLDAISDISDHLYGLSMGISRPTWAKLEREQVKTPRRRTLITIAPFLFKIHNLEDDAIVYAHPGIGRIEFDGLEPYVPTGVLATFMSRSYRQKMWESFKPESLPDSEYRCKWESEIFTKGVTRN